MKNFSRPSIFLALLVVIVVAILGYYFLIFTPARVDAKKQSILQNQIKCSEAGQKYVAKNVDETVPYGASYEAPQYSFSEDLNTCLYRKEFSTYWSDGSLGTTDYSIIDVYSNRTIASIFKHYDSKGVVNNTIGDEGKYQDFVDRYFGSSISEN